MKPKVYLETSVISYLAGWSSRDLIVAAHQQITQEWWKSRRIRFELFISQLVVQEAQSGDPEAAQRRFSIIDSLPLLELNSEILKFADSLVKKKIIPLEFAEDSLHIAVATVHGMDYLLTWNCKHIANAEIQKKVTALGNKSGYNTPVICTPEELLGE